MNFLVAYQQISAGESFKEAAFEVGFNPPSHFTRRFKGRFGVLPSIFRGTPREVLRTRLQKATADKITTLARLKDFLMPSEKDSDGEDISLSQFRSSDNGG